MIVIDYDKVHHLYEKMSENWDWTDFTEFLSISIPGFASRLLSSKDKISKMFTEEWFVAGTAIAVEGHV